MLTTNKVPTDHIFLGKETSNKSTGSSKQLFVLLSSQCARCVLIQYSADVVTIYMMMTVSQVQKMQIYVVSGFRISLAQLQCHYRATHHIVSNLPLTPKQKLRFSTWASY